MVADSQIQQNDIFFFFFGFAYFDCLPNHLENVAAPSGVGKKSLATVLIYKHKRLTFSVTGFRYNEAND